MFLKVIMMLFHFYGYVKVNFCTRKSAYSNVHTHNQERKGLLKINQY